MAKEEWKVNKGRCWKTQYVEVQLGGQCMSSTPSSPFLPPLLPSLPAQLEPQLMPGAAPTSVGFCRGAGTQQHSSPLARQCCRGWWVKDGHSAGYFFQAPLTLNVKGHSFSASVT